MKTKNGSFSLGFVMPEMFLNVMVGSLALVGAGSFGVSSAHKIVAMTGLPGRSHQNQDATSLIAQDVRQASSVERADAGQIVLRTESSEGFSTVTYTYNRTQGTLMREDGRASQTVLTGLNNFAFSMFQQANTDVTAGAENTNLVGCQWSCSTKSGQDRMDTEQITMAPVLVRNHR